MRRCPQIMLLAATLAIAAWAQHSPTEFNHSDLPPQIRQHQLLRLLTENGHPQKISALTQPLAAPSPSQSAAPASSQVHQP
jgi:hypothetical protein